MARKLILGTDEEPVSSSPLCSPFEEIKLLFGANSIPTLVAHFLRSVWICILSDPILRVNLRSLEPHFGKPYS